MKKSVTISIAAILSAISINAQTVNSLQTTPSYYKESGLNLTERVNEIADSIMQVNNIKESDRCTAIQYVPDFKPLIY